MRRSVVNNRRNGYVAVSGKNHVAVLGFIERNGNARKNVSSVFVFFIFVGIKLIAETGNPYAFILAVRKIDVKNIIGRRTKNKLVEYFFDYFRIAVETAIFVRYV